MGDIISDTYGFGGGVDTNLFTVRNGFIAQLANLAMQSGRELKTVAVVTRDKVNNRGEVNDKAVGLADKTVVNMCKLSPLCNVKGCKTLLAEVATIRSAQYNDSMMNKEFIRKKAINFFYDYLLSSCLCYVEVFGGIKVEKFFATKNRFIAGAMAGIADNETAKYSNYLSMTREDFDVDIIRVLKMRSKTEGFSITQPRAGIRLTDNIKVTPVFLMIATSVGALNCMKDHILEFTYLKDNLQERDMCSTLNRDIMMQYYNDVEYVDKALGGVDNNIKRGYIKIPELGLSKYDDTGVRALNLTRITKMRIIDAIDARFIDVDFNCIMPNFMDSCDRLVQANDLASISMIYQRVFGEKPTLDNPIALSELLQGWAKSQFALGTTTFQRQLHLIMLEMPMLFNGYSGKRQQFSGNMGNGFNMGVNL